MDINQQETQTNTEVFYLQRYTKYMASFGGFLFIIGSIAAGLGQGTGTLMAGVGIIAAFMHIIQHNVPYIMVRKSDLTIQTSIISRRVTILFSEVTSIVIKDGVRITIFYQTQHSDDTKGKKVHIAHTFMTDDVSDVLLGLLKKHLGDKFV